MATQLDIFADYQPRPKKADKPTFEQAFFAFFERVQRDHDRYMAAEFPSNPRHVFGYEEGPKYVRVFYGSDRQGGPRYAYCFVEKATGNILKADGWKRPAKGARGNIYELGAIRGNMGTTGWLYR